LKQMALFIFYFLNHMSYVEELGGVKNTHIGI